MTALAEIDPLALELTNELNEKAKTDVSDTWEHQSLAKVKIRVMRGHSDAINSCRFCCYDKKILTASDDGTVRLWSFESSGLEQTYTGHVGNVSAACPAPKYMKQFASVGWDKKLHVWDTDTGQIAWSGQHGGIVTCCCYSHNGKLIVTASDLDNIVNIWDANTGALLHEIKDLHSSTVTSCYFTPQDDRIITTSMDRTIKFWDLTTRKNTITLADGHINVITDCSYTNDERRLATVSWDKDVLIWDIPTGSYRSSGPTRLPKIHEGSVNACVFSKDGETLVTGSSDMSLVVWDVGNSVQKLKLQGHEDWIQDVHFSQDQKWLMSCSKDKTVRIWNVEKTEHIPKVLENKRSIGLKIAKCLECGKPFSMAQVENPEDSTCCVFCRMDKRINNSESQQFLQETDTTIDDK